MPKYRNKRRLRQKGDVDQLTQFLILADYDDEVVNLGLVWFVEVWEEAVTQLERFGCDCQEEWDWVLWRRDKLAEVLAHTRPEQVKPYDGRIENSDEHFRELTTLLDILSTSDSEAVQAGRWWWGRQGVS
jgi:hypothetical protein